MRKSYTLPESSSEESEATDEESDFVVADVAAEDDDDDEDSLVGKQNSDEENSTPEEKPQVWPLVSDAPWYEHLPANHLFSCPLSTRISCCIGTHANDQAKECQGGDDTHGKAAIEGYESSTGPRVRKSSRPSRPEAAAAAASEGLPGGAQLEAVKQGQ